MNPKQHFPVFRPDWYRATEYYRNLGGTSTVKLSNRGKQLHAKHWSGMVQKISELIELKPRLLNLDKLLDANDNL